MSKKCHLKLLMIFFSFQSLFSAEKPNIIVILADDLGYADVGFHEIHEKDINTPNMDKLAASGVTFTNAYASSPICSASRLGFSTGRYQERWGAYWYGQGGLVKDEQTIAEYLLGEGYTTMKVGKTHLNGGQKQDPLSHGFENWLGFIHHSHDFHMLSSKDVEAYEKRKRGGSKHNQSPIGPLSRNNTLESFENTTTTEVFARESVNFIKAKKNKPFYLQLEFNAVHTVMIRPPNKELAEKYGIPMRHFDRNAKEWEFPNYDPVKEKNFKSWYSKVAHKGEIDPYGRKLYLAYLEEMDSAIGRIMTALQETDQVENTLIFFSSDNGGSHQSYANNGKLNVYKYCLLDGGIKVPMLISWPNRIKKNGKVDALVTHRDFFPTICSVIGAKSKKSLDGKSLLPAIDGKVHGVHDGPLYWDIGKSWVIRDGKWKVIQHENLEYSTYKTDENGLVVEIPPITVVGGTKLFDMESDPGETQDLSVQYPEKMAEMQKRYTEWRSQMPNPKKSYKKR